VATIETKTVPVPVSLPEWERYRDSRSQQRKGEIKNKQKKNQPVEIHAKPVEFNWKKQISSPFIQNWT
jgi:hypothetical protein